MVFLSIRLPDAFFGKSHAGHYAHDNNACEEDNECQAISTRNFSDPKQNITDGQIQERPNNVRGWR
jgi:hypothetical protein